MQAIDTIIATDIMNVALDHYVKGQPFMQSMTDKPLLKALKKETFSGGLGLVSIPVQGKFMDAQPGFFHGYEEDDAVVFKQAMNVDRAKYKWYEHHAGLIITETELKKDGISVTDDMKTSEHSQSSVHQLVKILKNRLADFGESWSRALHNNLWMGPTNPKTAPGLLTIITGTPTTDMVGGISSTANTWWQTRAAGHIPASESLQTLTKFLRKEVRQLRKFGGKPNTCLCGSVFLAALEGEIQAKGYYTDSGFSGKKNELGMSDISLTGLGTFIYDPWLDDHAMSDRCYIFDNDKIKMYVMEGEENKVRNPTRPYDYFIFLRSMTTTYCLGSKQQNSNAVYQTDPVVA